MLPLDCDHPLRRLFAGLVEDSFYSQVGICDPILTAYVVDLLIEFMHMDRLTVLSTAEDKDLDRLAAMLAVTESHRPMSETQRDRLIYRHIGDYALFWAGVYPEHLQSRRAKRRDVLADFVTKGKRSYAIASQLAGENDNPSCSLFRHLSEDFEHCLHGLGVVRRGWELASKEDGSLPGGLLI